MSLIPAWVDGVLTPVDKLEVHRRGLRHQAVSVFAIRGGKTLIQRRALGKYHTPGLWANTCCTHPDWAELPLACAHRRLGQELGIEGITPVHRGQVRYRADVGGGLIENEVVEIFRVCAGAEMTVTANPAEVMDTRWIEIDDLLAEVAQKPQDFTPWMRIYLAEHLDMIVGSA